MKQYFLFFSLLIICISSAKAKPTTGTITGNIYYANNKPVRDIQVILKNTNYVAISNEKGFFSIADIKPGEYTLVVGDVSTQIIEKTVKIEAGKTLEMQFYLKTNNRMLEGVTIIAERANKYAVKESEYVSKMPLKNIENPQVYNVIGKNIINDQVLFSVDDAMRNAAGVQKMWEATGRSGDGGSYYNARGFIMQSNLRNGIAGVVSNEIDILNLERVEVIKGPSATLFGSALTSYGGLINRVTKKPFDTLGLEVSLAGGNFNFRRGAVDVNTPLNQSKTLLFRLNGAYKYNGTFQTEGFDENIAIAPALQFKPSERLTVNVDAELNYGSNVGKQILFFYSPAASLGVSNANDVNLDYNNSYIGDGLSQRYINNNIFSQVDYDISSAIKSSTFLSYGYSFSDGFNPYFYLQPENGTNRLVRADQSTANSKRNVYNIQQLFNANFKIKNLQNKLVFGLDFLSQDNNQFFFGSVFDNISPNSNNSTIDRFNGNALSNIYNSSNPQFTYPLTTQINTFSAFVSDVLNITDKFSVLAALRADRFMNRGGKVGADVTPFNQNALSPKLGIVYQPVKDKVAIFANYQNSFRNLGAYASFNTSEPDSLSLTNAKLENANQLEGGLKLDVFKGKISAVLSVYQIDVDNILRADPAFPVLASIQDATQRSRGFEVEINTNPLKNLNINAGFSYNDSEFINAAADVIGRRPATASSPYLANFWANYKFSTTALKGFGIGFGGNYASDNKILNSVSLGEFTLPAYTVLNTSLFYDFKKIRLSLKADNLTDERYWIGYTTMNPQRPRSFALNFVYKL